MAWLARVFSSSIGKKQLVAVTGLGLCGFLVAHLSGNFLLFAGQEAFDAYAKMLEENIWFLIPAEIGLLAMFVIHIGLAVRLTLENKTARGGRYQVHGNRGAETAAGTTMIISGVIILIFLVLHIISFKFGDRIDGSLYKLVMNTFQQSTGYVIWYVVASCTLAFHLSHGVQSAFRTLGLHHPKYETWIQNAGYGFAFIVGAGYSSLPIYAKYFAEPVS